MSFTCVSSRSRSTSELASACGNVSANAISSSAVRSTVMTNPPDDAVGGRAAAHRRYPRSDAVLDRVELDVLAWAGDRDRFQHADTRRVELVLVVRLDQ